MIFHRCDLCKKELSNEERLASFQLSQNWDNSGIASETFCTFCVKFAEEFWTQKATIVTECRELVQRRYEKMRANIYYQKVVPARKLEVKVAS